MRRQPARFIPEQTMKKLQLLFACSLILLLIGVTLTRSADLTVSESKNAQGEPQVILENEFYRLTFTPAKGGRCSGFFIKATQREWVYDGDTAGLFEDHFAHQPWPGELFKAKYDYAIEGDRTKEVALRLWTIAKGGDDGRDLLTQGLKVEKTIILQAARRDIVVRNTFINPTDEGKNVAMWIQHCFCYGGDRLFDLYYRPSAEGIKLDGMDDKGEQNILPGIDAYAQDWVKQPVAGWSAGRDRRTNEGGVFLMDYNYLNILYNSAGSYTTEWFMDKVPIPQGKSWSTEYRIVPVSGFTGFSCASPRLIANTEITAKADAVEISHQLAGTMAALGTVKISTTVYGIRSKKEIKLAEITAGPVGLEPLRTSQSWNQLQTEPLVFRITVSGDNWQEAYEYVFAGTFASKGIEGSSHVAEYKIPRPKKEKVFLKPDVWTRPANPHLRVLVMCGLFTHCWGLEEAVKKLDPAAEIKLCDGWDFFPPTYDELLKYDLLILSNMPAGPDFANEMVADFVRHGGSLLVLGGMNTYGGGEWLGTPLADLLPFTIAGAFDLIREKHGVKVKTKGMHSVTADVVWPPEARFFWLKAGKAKPGSTVVLTADGKPALILGQVGDGRIAAGLVTCLGEPGSDQSEAWTTPAWSKLLTQTMAWMNGK